MKSVPKLIRRFVGILLLSSILLIILNIILLVVFTMRQIPNAQPWKTAEEVVNALHQTTSLFTVRLLLFLKQSSVCFFPIHDIIINHCPIL